MESTSSGRRISDRRSFDAIKMGTFVTSVEQSWRVCVSEKDRRAIGKPRLAPINPKAPPLLLLPLSFTKHGFALLIRL